MEVERNDRLLILNVIQFPFLINSKLFKSCKNKNGYAIYIPMQFLGPSPNGK